MSSQHTQYHVHKLPVSTLPMFDPISAKIQYNICSNIDGNVQQSHNSFELKNGKCQPLQRLAMDIDVQYSNGQFLDAKVMLNVIMVSVNGKVPAGGVAITVAEGGRVYVGDKQETRYIDKCADKAAKITYQIKCTHLRTITKNRNTSTITKSAIKFTPKISASNSEALNLKDLLSVAKKHTIAASHVNLNISHQNESHSQSHINLNSHASKNRTFFNYQNVKKKVKGSQKSQSSEQKSQSQKQSIYAYQNKSRCAESRTYLHFDKYSLKDNISQHTPQPLTRLKSQLQSQWEQLQCYRQKNTQLEHKIREQLHQIRQYKDNVDKLRSKINNIENINYELKSSIEEKQRCVEKLLGELKVMKEYCEQVKVGAGMQDKKNQIKYSINNDHLKKLTQKYQKSQSQRQTLLHTLSSKLTQFQQTQKNSQQVYKQKERILLEQKNKISKKLQTTLNSLQTLIEQHNQLKNQFQLLSTHCHQLEKSKRELEADGEENRGRVGMLEGKVGMLEGRVRELEGVVGEVGEMEGKIVEGNRKYQQLNSEYSRLKQQKQTLTQKLQLQTRLHNNSQQTLKQTQQHLHSQSTRLSTLTHNLQIQTNKQQQLQQKIEQLQKSYKNLQKQYTTIQQKYYNDVHKLQQINTKLQNQVRYLCKSKETIFQEYQQMKWKVCRLEEREVGGRREVREAGEAVGKVKEELYAEQEKYRKQVQKCKQLQIQLQTLHQHLHQQSQKLTQQSQTLKKTCTTLQQTQTQLLHHQSQSKQASEQVAILESTLQQQKHKYSLLQQQLNKISILHEEEIDKLSSINHQVQEELISAKRDVLTARAEYEDVRGEVGGLKDRVRRLEREIQGKEGEVRGLEGQLSAVKEAEKKYIAQIKNKDLEIMDIKNQFEKFKVQLSNNIQLLTSELHKLEKPSSLPPYLQPLYSRFQKHTTETIQKFSTQNQNYKNQIQQLQQQLTKQKKNNKQLAQQFEEQIMNQKIKYNQFVGQSMMEKNELIDKLEKMEERVGELEGEIGRLRVRGGEYDNEIKQWRQKVNELQQQLHQKQKTLNKKQSEYTQKCQQLQSARRNPSNISLNTQQQRLIIEKQKNNIKQLQRKLVEIQKQLNERQQSIRNLQNSLVSKTYQLEKEKRNCQDTLKIVQMLRGQVKGLREDGGKVEVKIRDLQTILQTTNKQLQQQKHKNEAISQNLQKSQSKTSQLQKSLQLLQTSTTKTEQCLESQLQTSLQSIQTLQKQQQQAQKQKKQTEQKLIQTTSKLQLSQFMIQQLQQQISQIKNNNMEYMLLVDQKKNQIIYLNSVIQAIKSQNLVLRGECEGLRVDRDGLEERERGYKGKLEVLGAQVGDVGVVQDMLEKQRKQNQKLRNHLQTSNTKYSTIQKQLQSLTHQYKKQLSSKLSKQQQHKKRIRDLQKQISSNIHEKSLILQNKEQIHTRQRTDLLSTIQQLEQQNNKYRIMYQNLRQQSKKQLQILNQECAELTGLLTQKEELLCVKDEKIRGYEGKIGVLMGQIRECMEAWEAEKKGDGGKGVNLESKAAKIMGEVDARSRTLLTSFNKPTKIH